MKQVVATIIKNIGFDIMSKRGLYQLTSICVRFFEQFIHRSKIYSEFGNFLSSNFLFEFVGKNNKVLLNDVFIAMNEMNISLEEIHRYIKEIRCFETPLVKYYFFTLLKCYLGKSNSYISGCFFKKFIKFVIVFIFARYFNFYLLLIFCQIFTKSLKIN